LYASAGYSIGFKKIAEKTESRGWHAAIGRWSAQKWLALLA
jgi:hypothetical protein